MKTIAAFVVILIVTTSFENVAKMVSEIANPPRKYSLMEAGLGYKMGERIEPNETENFRKGYTVTTIRGDDIDLDQQKIRSHPIERIELYHTPGAGLCRVAAQVKDVPLYEYDGILERFAREYGNPTVVSKTLERAAWTREYLVGKDLLYMCLDRNIDSGELDMLDVLYVFDNHCDCVHETEKNEDVDYNDSERTIECSWDADHFKSNFHNSGFRFPCR